MEFRELNNMHCDGFLRIVLDDLIRIIVIITIIIVMIIIITIAITIP